MTDNGSDAPEPPDRHQASARRWQVFVEELRRRLGSGAPLEHGVRAAFEGRLGQDLSGVLLHRAPFSGRLVHAFGAQAMAAGGHVFGSSEDLDSATPRGAALLGHELTHTLQAATAGPAPSVQRAATDEAQAQVVEQAVAQQAAAPAAPAASPAGIDTEALAERVYQLMHRRLIEEGERGAGQS